jgi:enterochelin esterase-like enzyme
MKAFFMLTILLSSVVLYAQPASPNGFGGKQPMMAGDSDTAWVSPDKSTISIASYQLYPTPARGANTFGSYIIYLPKEYKETTKRYPVIYYLHGGNGTQRDAQWLMKKMDAAIAEGKMPPVIVVGVQALPIGWYCNANVGATGVISGPIEDVIINNLIPHIDATYRTIATNKGRGLEGWSMGGFGATRLAFKYPNLFGFASSLAGAVIDFKDERNPQYLSNTFGPTSGENEAKSIAYFNAVHPKYYAQKNAKAIVGNVKVRLIVGKEDWLYSQNGKLITQIFSDYLTSLGISNKYSVIEGVGHMLPSEFEQNKVVYPIDFWVEAFKGL